MTEEQRDQLSFENVRRQRAQRLEREDIALQALNDATREMLSDTEKYAYTQECSVSLCFSEGKWYVEVGPAFISALTGGAARG